MNYNNYVAVLKMDHWRRFLKSLPLFNLPHAWEGGGGFEGGGAYMWLVERSVTWTEQVPSVTSLGMNY